MRASFDKLIQQMKGDQSIKTGNNTYLMILIAIVAGLFLYSIRSILSPSIVFFFFLVLIFPLSKNPVVIRLVIALSILFLIWFFKTTSALLSPFILSLVLAYLFDPFIDRLERNRIPRSLAIFLMIVPIVAGIFVLLYAFIPKLIRDGTRLIEAAPGVIDKVQQWIQAGLSKYGDFEIDFVDDLTDIIRTHGIEMLRRLGKGAVGIGKGIGVFVTFGAYVVMTPVVTFYLLRDFDKLKQRIVRVLPQTKRNAIVNFANEYDSALGKYLRGQLIVSSIIGAMTCIGFLLWGMTDQIFLPFAVLLGVITGIFSIVPYVGVVVSIIPALIIAFLSESLWYSLVGVTIVFGVVQSIEGNFISPKIIGESVGLHPVLIMLALLLCPFFLGFVGLLIAIPIAVLIRLIAVKSLDAYLKSDMYLSH